MFYTPVLSSGIKKDEHYCIIIEELKSLKQELDLYKHWSTIHSQESMDNKLNDNVLELRTLVCKILEKENEK